MKGLTKLFAGVFAVAVLASCGGNGAEKVATSYLTALKANDVAKAKEFANKEAQELLEMLKSVNMVPVIEDVKDVKCTENGNEATCTYCCTKDGNGQLKLVKEGDKWLVKEFKEGGEAGPEGDEEIAPEDSTSLDGVEVEEVEVEEVPAAE